MIGGAAEVVERRCLEGEVREPDVLAAIEILHPRIELEAAALEQQDFERSVGELAGDGDAGGAGADDAEVTLEDGSVVQRPGVGVH